MCGIVGYVGKRPVQDLLLEGLTRLEYRGYDSAGISMIAGDTIDSVRAVGNLEHLRDAVSARVDDEPGGVATATRPATTGIGHTRWATHGRVNEENAHPHFDTADRVHIVVNGIVENYLSMRERLTDMGAVFTSETDAEVIAHLIAHHMATGSLLEAVRAAYAELEGHYAFVAMSLDEPETLVGARKECPLIVGRGEGETFFASAIPAFLRETRQVQYIENGEIVEITPEGTTFVLPDGTELEREVVEIDWDEETAEKGGFETFMLKEIHEQADAVAETIADRTVRSDGVDLDDVGALDEALLRDVKRIIVVACGTSYHAGLIGRYAIEEWARIPVEMDIASEYRYRNPVVGPGDLVIGITQSGETADTLAAMRIAQRARRDRARADQHHGLAGHARRRRRALHARRARGLRGRHEDLHLPGRRDVPARPQARRAARHADRRAPRRDHRRPQAHPALHRGAAGHHRRRRCRRSPTRTGTRTSSSTSAATSASRWRSRARSSSRRSPTSPPTRTRRAR